MLIATLPSAHNTGLIEEMYRNPGVGGARYNAGIRTLYSPERVVSYLKKTAEKYGKKLWVDLKGRQLRITKWADPSYGDIELNHEIEVKLPAKIFFRGNEWSNVVGVDGNKIAVDPDPKYALGAGQAVNIIGKGLKIKGGYLTEKDKEYVEASKKLGVHSYMLSFAEKREDLDTVRRLDPDAEFVLKIENKKGLSYVETGYKKEDGTLMAARDDLMINIGENKFKMIPALELIIEKDKDAIAASHIFTSLDTLGYLSLSDISDVNLLQDMGYKNFMLSDGVSHRRFKEAVKAWEDFRKIKNE